MRPRTRSDFLVGLFFAAVGVAFVLEAEGAWTFRFSQLAVVGPVLMILGGLALLTSAVHRGAQGPSGVQAGPAARDDRA